MMFTFIDASPVYFQSLTYTLSMISIVLLSIASRCLCLPEGHGKPLGEHNDLGTLNIEDDYTKLTPKSFYEKYVSTRTPVILRNLAKTFPAYHKWTDDYIKENFGELEVRLEAKKEKETYTPVSEIGMGRSTFKEFLARYKTDNMYCVSEVPGPMYKDLEMPAIMNCGGLGNALVEMNIWINSGGAMSIIHKDAHNQLNCLLAGSKDWIFINNSYNEWIYQAEEVDGNHGGFSLVNPEAINYITFPDFKKVPWTYSTVHAGDCLYLPPRYYHRVKSADRNFAVSFLFGTSSVFNMEGCDTTGSSVNLDKVPIQWKYPGHGVMSMGNDSPQEWKEEITRLFKESYSGTVSIDAFYNSVLRAYSHIPAVESGLQDVILGDSIMGDYISLEKIENYPIEVWKALAMAASFDPSNHPDVELYHIDEDDVQDAFKEAAKFEKLDFIKFIKIYTSLPFNGSPRVGKELFAKISSDGKTVSYEQLATTKAFTIYGKEYDKGEADMNERNNKILEKAKEDMAKSADKKTEL